MISKFLRVCLGARVCTPGHSDVSFLISGRACRSGRRQRGLSEEEASHALCTDKALDAATSAGTLGGEEAEWSSPEGPLVCSLTVLGERKV